MNKHIVKHIVKQGQCRGRFHFGAPCPSKSGREIYREQTYRETYRSVSKVDNALRLLFMIVVTVISSRDMGPFGSV